MLKSTTRTAVLSLVTASFLAVGASASFAQQEVTDEQLASFVDATNEIVEIREHYQAQAATVESEEEMGELERQANEEMVEAVEGAGLDVEQYNMIAQAAQQDPELDDRIVEMMMEAQ